MDASSGTVRWTCGAVGACTVDVTVIDNGAPNLSDSEKLTIQCTNAAPALAGSPGNTAAEGVVYSYDISCTDGDGDTLTLRRAARDTCGGMISTTGNGQGRYTFTPGETQGGTSCLVDIDCSDTLASANESAGVSIDESNMAPVLSNLPGQASAAWGRAGSFTATASDADLPDNTLTWGLGSHDCPFSPAVDASSGTVSWTCGAVGACTVDVTVSDDGSPSLNDTGKLTIQCTNSAPVLQVPAPASIYEEVSLQVALTCSDGENDTLSMALASGDTCGGSLMENPAQGVWTYAMSIDEAMAPTVCEIKVSCMDGQATTTESRSVSVNEVNRPPVLSNLPGRAGALWGRTGAFTASADDPDLPANILSWSLGTNGCSFTPAVTASTGEVRWTCGNRVESCAAQVVVTDDGVPSLSDSETLTIACTNTAPVLTLGDPGTIAEGSVLSAAARCTDADGDSRGGAIYIQQKVNIRNSVFIANSARRGGAVFQDSTDYASRIENALFLGNHTWFRGAGLQSTRYMEVLNSTFHGNYKVGSCPAVLYHMYGNYLKVKNTIMWGGRYSRACHEEIWFNSAHNPSFLYNNIDSPNIGNSGGDEGNIRSAPKFIHAPRYWDRTKDAGTSTTLKVDYANIYKTGQVLELDGDGVARTVTGVVSGEVTFSPALPFASLAGMAVEIWDSGETDLREDYRLRADSPGRNAGTPDGAPGGDILGSPRSSCPGGVDMGAREFQCYDHAMAIDGANDFSAGETFATSSGGYTGYYSWDTRNLYVGMKGPDIAGGSAQKWVLVYLGGTGGTTTGETYRTQTPALPFAALYHLRWKADGSYTNLMANTGGSWTGITWNGQASRSGDFVELSIPWSDIGNPSELSIHLNMIDETNLNEWSYAAVPDASYTDGYNPAYGKYYKLNVQGILEPADHQPLP